MMKTTAELIQLLRQTPFFSGSESVTLRRLTAMLEPATYADGQVIFEPGAPSERLFLVVKGQVRLERAAERESSGFANLAPGDYFGEEAWLLDDPRFYRAVAVGEVVLLGLHVQTYLALLDSLPGVERMLEVTVQSRHLSMEQHLPWLGEDEFVHVISRRHPAILAAQLLLPVASGLVALLISLLMLAQWFPGKPVGWVVMGIGIPIAILWVVWTYLDWRCDFFLLTNKRVVRIERVAFVYDSRQEAPLRTLMSAGIQKTRLGSLLGFADVIVQTYVGTIRLDDLGQAETIAHLIDFFWHRAEFKDRNDEAVLMNQKLNQKLDGVGNGLEDRELDPIAHRRDSSSAVEMKEPGFLGWLFGDFIRLRYEHNGAITYRKHWFVLIKYISLPFILMLIVFIVLVVRMGGMLAFLPMTGTFIGLSLILFGTFLWTLYQYVDWRDDIFQVTRDQIVDFDRKPLGKSRRRAAPLENVLSIEYERRGVWGNIFNFGTVYISVGTERLTFDYVYNPSAVQQDIFFRMGERVEEMRQFEIDSERERVSEWIATYHRRMKTQPPSEEDTKKNNF